MPYADEDDDDHGAGRQISPAAWMEELCQDAGGYRGFFRSLVCQFWTWWFAVIGVPALFLDHHRCEASQPFEAWLLYAAVVCAMITMAVLLELSVVKKLGLMEAGLGQVWAERQWRIPLIGTVLWKLDSYTDVVFIFLAKDCGSSLWQASLATFCFSVCFAQLLLNVCFACTDCDKELPGGFGFVLLDFKLVNNAIRNHLPFDPDATYHLPIARPVTLRSASQLVNFEKTISDVAQVSIQVMFLRNAVYGHSFVFFSILVSVLNGASSLSALCRDWYQGERSLQGKSFQQGTALEPRSSSKAQSYGTSMIASPPGSRMPTQSRYTDREHEQRDRSAARATADRAERDREPGPRDGGGGRQLPQRGSEDPLDLL